MNRFNVGQTILLLRKEKNMTQDQLASLVGVSAGAVSKWENGNSTPDISLLAPLARALNTTIDALLSFQQELSESEVINIKKHLTQVFLHEGYSSGEIQSKKYLNEYPNSIHLKFIIGGLLNMYLMMSEDHSEEFIKTKMNYCLSLLTQVAESKEPKYTSDALYLIASIQMMLGNYEESEGSLKKLPQEQVNPMDLYPTLLLSQGKYEEAKNLCTRELMKCINQSILTLITLANISKKEQNYEKALFYLNTAYELQGTFKIGLSSAALNCSKIYIVIGQKESAAQWFYTYVKELLSTGYDYYNNPYFKDIKLAINEEGQKIVRKKLLQSLIEDEDLKPLTGIVDYDKAIQELKETYNKM